MWRRCSILLILGLGFLVVPGLKGLRVVNCFPMLCPELEALSGVYLHMPLKTSLL